jgi:hypothetical protein
VLPDKIPALRQACEVSGIAAGSPAEAVCWYWHWHRPHDALFKLWAQYLRSTSDLQTPFLRRAMAKENEERQVLAQVRTVLAGSTDFANFAA